MPPTKPSTTTSIKLLILITVLRIPLCTKRTASTDVKGKHLGLSSRNGRVIWWLCGSCRRTLTDPSRVSYLVLSVRVAIPVNVGEGPNSTRRSKLKVVNNRTWVWIQRTVGIVKGFGTRAGYGWGYARVRVRVRFLNPRRTRTLGAGSRVAYGFSHGFPNWETRRYTCTYPRFLYSANCTVPNTWVNRRQRIKTEG